MTLGNYLTLKNVGANFANFSYDELYFMSLANMFK